MGAWVKTATIGAKAGTDIKDSAGNVLANEDIRNDDLSINYSGTNIQIKKGNTQIGSNVDAPGVLKNATIAINTTTGVLSGIGTGTGSRVFNDLIGVSMATSGVNQGRITLAGVGASNTTVDVTKSNLGLSYTDGATVGAVAGTNLFKADGTTGLGDDDIVTSAGTSANTANVGNVTVTNAQNRLGAITNAGAWDGSTIAATKGGTGATNLNAVQNDRVTTNADGTLKYDGTSATAPSLANIAGIVGKTSGGFGESLAGKTGAPYFSSAGNFSFGTIPAANGGTGLTSVSTLTNSNVTTYEVNNGGFIGAWTNISGEIDPPAVSYPITITWRNGAGTSLGTTVITVARNSGGTALDAAVTTSNGASATVSLGNAVSSGTIQTTTVTKNSVPVIITASILDGSGWGFK